MEGFFLIIKSCEVLYLDEDGKAQITEALGYYAEDQFFIAQKRDTQGRPISKKQWNIWHVATKMLANSRVYPTRNSCLEIVRLVYQLSDRSKWDFVLGEAWYDDMVGIAMSPSTLEHGDSLLMGEVFNWAWTVREMRLRDASN